MDEVESDLPQDAEQFWQRHNADQQDRAVAQLEIESRNPKDGLLATLKSYREVDGGRVGGVQARVAPTVLARLYKSGRGARAELDNWLRQKELVK